MGAAGDALIADLRARFATPGVAVDGLAAFDESFLMLAALCVLAMAAAWQLRGANTPSAKKP